MVYYLINGADHILHWNLLVCCSGQCFTTLLFFRYLICEVDTGSGVNIQGVPKNLPNNWERQKIQYQKLTLKSFYRVLLTWLTYARTYGPNFTIIYQYFGFIWPPSKNSSKVKWTMKLLAGVVGRPSNENLILVLDNINIHYTLKNGGVISDGTKRNSDKFVCILSRIPTIATFSIKIHTTRCNFRQNSDKSGRHFQKWGCYTPTPPLSNLTGCWQDYGRNKLSDSGLFLWKPIWTVNKRTWTIHFSQNQNNDTIYAGPTHFPINSFWALKMNKWPKKSKLRHFSRGFWANWMCAPCSTFNFGRLSR